MFVGTHRLQLLLDLHIQCSCLHGDNIGGGIGIVCDWGATLGAKDPMNGFTGAAHARPAFGRTLDLDFSLRNYRNKSL